MKLESRSIGKILKIFLYVVIGFEIIGVMNNIFDTFLGNFYDEYLATFDISTSLMLMVISYILIVLYLIWLYKVHKDLNLLELNYTITPGGALARLMIPVYNIYGMWNVYSVMATRLKQRSNTNNLGKNLMTCIPFYYFLHLVTQTLNRYLIKSPLNGVTVQDSVYLVSAILGLALSIIYLLMFNAVTSSLEIISGIPPEEENENEELNENGDNEIA